MNIGEPGLTSSFMSRLLITWFWSKCSQLFLVQSIGIDSHRNLHTTKKETLSLGYSAERRGGGGASSKLTTTALHNTTTTTNHRLVPKLSKNLDNKCCAQESIAKNTNQNVFQAPVKEIMQKKGRGMQNVILQHSSMTILLTFYTKYSNIKRVCSFHSNI